MERNPWADRDAVEIAAQAIRDELLATDPAGYAGCCAAIRDMDMQRPGALNSVPTLVIGGFEDLAIPPADSEALAVQLRDARTAFLAEQC